MQNRGLARLKQSREFLPEGYANSEVATTGRRQTAAAVPLCHPKKPCRRRARPAMPHAAVTSQFRKLSRTPSASARLRRASA